MKKAYKQLWKFHKVYNCHRSKVPCLPNEETRELRKNMLLEEYKEYLKGEDDNDIVEIADALADIIYIAIGTAVSYGIPIDKVFNEVHKSNMSKLGKDGKPIYREDGKVMKGPLYFKPDIKGILEKS